MYKKSHFILVLLLFFALISTASCKQGTSSDYPVMESGYNAFSDGGSNDKSMGSDSIDLV